MHTKEATEQEKKRQVDAVYASLRDGEDLEMIEASHHIGTSLLPHQKQALAFILDREKQRSFQKAAKDEIVSLWKPVRRGEKITSYENVVTQGEQKRAPHICRGAILADDMGLGKTLVAISLIASTLDDSAAFQEHGESSEIDEAPSNITAPVDSDEDDDVTIEDFTINLHGAPPPKKPRVKKERAKKKGKREQKKEDTAAARKDEIETRSRATLVILPLTLVSAWEAQIAEHWKPDERPDVYIYHGTGRLTDAKDIADHDIVMTTYATLATEYAHSIAEEEDSEADEVEDNATPKANGDDDDFKPGMNGDSHNGSKESSDKSKKAKKRKKRKAMEDKTISPIQQIEWFRIILDEAHTIKEARTLQSRAVCNLLAARRLCLTGTPVQNRIDDLFSLIRFLRLEPFDDRAVWNQYCGSNEKAASLRQSRKGNSERNPEPLDQMALARVQTIMKFLTLRRTKETKLANGEKILSLPPKYSRILTLKFDDRERGTYEEMRNQYKDDYEQMKAQDTLKHNYATILHEISNLRMTCDHMGLVDASKDAKRKKEYGVLDENPASAILKDGLSRDRAINLFEVLSSSDRARCRLCEFDLSSFADDGGLVTEEKTPVVTRCLHLFCSECLKTQIGAARFNQPKANDRFSCPECGETIAPLLEMRELLPADLAGDLGERVMTAETFGVDRGVEHDRRPDYSSKIRALMTELEVFSKCNRSSLIYDPDAPVLDQVAAEEAEEALAEPVMLVSSTQNPRAIKSVVFSQWTKMLDRVAKAVHRAGIKAAYLDGRMRRQERADNLEKFKEDDSVEVLLVSLKAGGIGLNLVSACRAYLMEPYWNPAIENQGLDRVHRMGQNRPVITTKFIMDNSIEENMLELQKRKLKLAESVGEKRSAERQREELNLLFSTRGEEEERQDT
jgi:SWI/SNF-related matrix-associated actin-dependent regulator of chromatin subfamily A3